VGVGYGNDKEFIFTPAAGYHVADLIVDGESQDSTGSFTFYNITENHTITVYFEINIYTLTINAVDGNVLKSPDQEFYDHGTSVELTAVPAEGYSFVEWSGNASGTANPLTITMDGNKVITAEFTLKSYTISASAVGNGTITPSGPVTVSHGEDIRFTISPDAGHHLDSLLVDEINTDSVSGYTFYNVTEDHMIRAVFRIDDNPLPVLSGIQPSSGYRGETIDIFFTGSGFTDGVTSLNLGDGILLNGMVIISGDSIRANVTVEPSALPGIRDFTVTNAPPGGGTSAALSFTVLNHLPSVFDLLLPTDGDTVQLTSPATPVTFTWNRSKDPDAGDTIVYALVIQEIEDTVFFTGDTAIAVDIQGMLSMNSLYHWYVFASDGYDTTVSADSFTFRTSDNIDGVNGDDGQIPTTYAIYQNYPNPFNPTTIIEYQVPEQSHILLKIYNLLGQEIASLVDEVKIAGRYSIEWIAEGTPSGIYLYRLTAGDFTQTKRMTLIK